MAAPRRLETAYKTERPEPFRNCRDLALPPSDVEIEVRPQPAEPVRRVAQPRTVGKGAATPSRSANRPASDTPAPSVEGHPRVRARVRVDVKSQSTAIGKTMGRKDKECAQMGVKTMALTDGWTIGPPALTSMLWSLLVSPQSTHRPEPSSGARRCRNIRQQIGMEGWPRSKATSFNAS